MIRDVSIVPPHLKVLITHDWITTWAGSERCLEQLLTLFPDAHLVVGVLAPALRNLNEVTKRAHETWLSKVPGARTHHRWFLPLEAAAFATINTDAYDLVISSSHAFSKMLRVKRREAHICYCYTPPRYLWDLQKVYRENSRPLQGAALAAGSGFMRWVDRYAASKVGHFIGISSYVADRIQRYYGRRADVVYPPVSRKTPLVASTTSDGFLLSLGRLVPYKRVDLTIQAAETLGVPLVVAGDGPDYRRLKRLAGKWTTFTGAVSEAEAGELLAKCELFVFCAEEDFGIAPLEANAYGKPVVAFASGAILETMVEGVTAQFFRSASPDSVAQAITEARSKRWDGERLRQNAARFSPQRFLQDFGSIVRRIYGREDS